MSNDHICSVMECPNPAEYPVYRSMDGALGGKQVRVGWLCLDHRGELGIILSEMTTRKWREFTRERPRKDSTTMGDARMAFMADVAQELDRAEREHPKLNSPHEAASVIREEYDEYWDLVKQKEDAHNLTEMYHELVQIAAMAMRAAIDTVMSNGSRRRETTDGAS